MPYQSDLLVQPKEQSVPHPDRIAKYFADSLSFETKMKLYKDLRVEFPNEAGTIMECDSIEKAIDEFAFQVFWNIQHRLLSRIMSEEEIERRVNC